MIYVRPSQPIQVNMRQEVNVRQQVNVLSHIDPHSDPYYLEQPAPGDFFAILSPNESVWQESISSRPYQPAQNHPVSMSTSYNNVYAAQYPDDAFPCLPTASVRPLEPAVGYGRTWTDTSASSIIPATAAPSITRPIPAQEDSADEPKIRRNNYSLLVHNHQFPALELDLPP